MISVVRIAKTAKQQLPTITIHIKKHCRSSSWVGGEDTCGIIIQNHAEGRSRCGCFPWLGLYKVFSISSTWGIFQDYLLLGDVFFSLTKVGGWLSYTLYKLCYNSCFLSNVILIPIQKSIVKSILKSISPLGNLRSLLHLYRDTVWSSVYTTISWSTGWM